MVRMVSNFCALNATLLIDCKYPLNTLKGENWPKTIEEGRAASKNPHKILGPLRNFKIQQ